MKTTFSSAGLLYVYLNGCEENGMLYVQQTDTYSHIEEGFYLQVMENAERANEEENIVHIFAVVGQKEKVNVVYSIVEDEIKINYQRILSGKKIRKSIKELDSTGNAFFRCVQEFYCEQSNHFPKKIYRDYDNLKIRGIYCGRSSNQLCNSIANEIVSLWVEREMPMLCGQQLMVRSFFVRDFIGRRVVATLPKINSGSWSLIFEGGHQLSLSAEHIYTKETVHPNDLGAFCSSNIQSILWNPIYAYGKWFHPNDICEEWHKTFLYLCAISNEKWDRFSISRVYEKFLEFLEDNICETTDAPSLISKDQYSEVLLTHISNFRNFLMGDDEQVLSKDLHQTLNSRYVYLPYLWRLVNQETWNDFFSMSILQKLIKQAIQEKDVYRKGVLWEDVAAYVLSNIEGLRITGRRIRAGLQEIDLSVINVSLDDRLWQLGAYILVECKNWTTHVNIHQIRNIAHISNMKGNKTCILFAANGITEDAQKEIQRLVTENIYIVCITTNELNHLRSSKDCKELLLSKWTSLQSRIELSDLI